MSLNEIETEQMGIVTEVLAKGLLKERLISLGLTKGLPIQVIRKGPKKNLTLYDIRGAMIALRKEEADLVKVELIKEKIWA